MLMKKKILLVKHSQYLLEIPADPSMLLQSAWLLVLLSGFHVFGGMSSFCNITTRAAQYIKLQKLSWQYVH